MATGTHARCRLFVDGQRFFAESFSYNKNTATQPVQPVGQLIADEIVITGVTVSGSIGRVKRVGSGQSPSGEGIAPSMAGTVEQQVRASVAFNGKDIDIYDIDEDVMIGKVVGFHVTGEGGSISPNGRFEENLSFTARNYLGRDEL